MGKTEERQASNPVVEEYARLAPVYDAKWSYYVERTVRETVARLSIRPNDRVLDVGCGTGALLHQLARKYPRAVLEGIDPVPEMLAVARQRLPPSAALRQGWAEQLPHANETFDHVVSCNMFHYIRQPTIALKEMGRVLRRGGQLVVTDWCDDYLACRVCDRYLRRFNPTHFKVYGERECLQLLDDAGYIQARIERYRISWFWGLMTANANKPTA